MSGSDRQHFTEQTRQLWQRKYNRSLTEEDCREIAHNVTGFFDLLRSWDNRKKESEDRAAIESVSEGQVAAQEGDPPKRE